MAEETFQGGTADQWAEYVKSLAVDIPEITWKGRRQCCLRLHTYYWRHQRWDTKLSR